jgi:outer membrane protein assembly factor BamC
MRRLRHLVAPILAMLWLAGCGSSSVIDDMIPDQTLAYKKQREVGQNLEVPPDLSKGNVNDALDVPATGSATFSEYAGERGKRRAVVTGGDVLPDVKDVELRREGDSRWLEVSAPASAVWPRVVSFWREQGILLVEQDPAVGVMKTDWLDNRAEIRQDFITRQLRKVAEGLYATSTRDQYRVRLERGAKAGATDIYLTHSAMKERILSNTVGEGNNAIWEPAPSDPGKEAEMLRRLMVYLGVTEQRASGATAAGTAPSAAEGTTRPTTARMVSEGEGSVLVISDEFRRAWRQTGLALDRIGFAVEDRDMSTGTYYVRYDPGSEGARKKEGFFSRMAFWRDRDIDPVKKYQVKLVASGTETRLSVLNAAGQRDDTPAGKKILTLLQEQIR